MIDPQQQLEVTHPEINDWYLCFLIHIFVSPKKTICNKKSVHSNRPLCNFVLRRLLHIISAITLPLFIHWFCWICKHRWLTHNNNSRYLSLWYLPKSFQLWMLSGLKTRILCLMTTSNSVFPTATLSTCQGLYQWFLRLGTFSYFPGHCLTEWNGVPWVSFVVSCKYWVMLLMCFLLILCTCLQGQ